MEEPDVRKEPVVTVQFGDGFCTELRALGEYSEMLFSLSTDRFTLSLVSLFPSTSPGLLCGFRPTRTQIIAPCFPWDTGPVT